MSLFLKRSQPYLNYYYDIYIDIIYINSKKKRIVLILDS